MSRLSLLTGLFCLLAHSHSAWAVTPWVRVTPRHLKDNPKPIQIIEDHHEQQSRFTVRVQITAPQRVSSKLVIKAQDRDREIFGTEALIGDAATEIRFAIPTPWTHDAVLYIELGGRKSLESVRLPGGLGGAIYEIRLRDFVTQIAPEAGAPMEPGKQNAGGPVGGKEAGSSDAPASPSLVSIVGSDLEAMVDPERTIGRFVASLQDAGAVQFSGWGEAPLDGRTRWAEIRLKPKTAIEGVKKAIETLRTLGIHYVRLQPSLRGHGSEVIVYLRGNEPTLDEAIPFGEALKSLSAGFDHDVKFTLESAKRVVEPSAESAGERKSRTNQGNWAFVLCGPDTSAIDEQRIRSTINGLGLPCELKQGTHAGVVIELLFGPQTAHDFVNRASGAANDLAKQVSPEVRVRLVGPRDGIERQGVAGGGESISDGRLANSVAMPAAENENVRPWRLLRGKSFLLKYGMGRTSLYLFSKQAGQWLEVKLPAPLEKLPEVSSQVGFVRVGQTLVAFGSPKPGKKAILELGDSPSIEMDDDMIIVLFGDQTWVYTAASGSWSQSPDGGVGLGGGGGIPGDPTSSEGGVEFGASSADKGQPPVVAR